MVRLKPIHLLLFLSLLLSQFNSIPISACSVLGSNTYTLTNDINTSTSCFEFSASNVYFDCNGSLINGTTNPNIYAFFKNESPLLTNITIANCRITNFGNAVLIRNASNIKLINISAIGQNPTSTYEGAYTLTFINGSYSYNISSRSSSLVGISVFTSENMLFDNIEVSNSSSTSFNIVTGQNITVNNSNISYSNGSMLNSNRVNILKVLNTIFSFNAYTSYIYLTNNSLFYNNTYNNNTNDTLVLDGVLNSTVTNNKFHNNVGTMLVRSDPSQNSTIVNISNNTFENGSVEGLIDVRGPTFNFYLHDNTFLKSIGLVGDIRNLYSSKVYNNKVLYSEAEGLYFENIIDTYIYSNNISHSNRTGILIRDGGPSAPNRNVSVENNTVFNVSTSGGQGGIFVQTVYGGKVKGNYIELPNNRGMAVRDSENVSVENNTFKDIDSLSPALLIRNSKNISVFNHSFISTSARYAIFLQSSLDNWIYDNIVFNSSYGVYADANSFNNTIYNNIFNVSTALGQINVYQETSNSNFWNYTYNCSSPNIIGGRCKGGNYYSDYNGVDTSYVPDGIGDSPPNYTFTNGIDYLPLTNNYSDGYPPVIDLITPSNNSVSTTSEVLFNCSAKDNINISNITIYIYNSTSLVFNDTINGTSNESYGIWLVNLTDGTYKWSCSAFDSSGNYNITENYSFSIDTTTPPAGGDTVKKKISIEYTQKCPQNEVEVRVSYSNQPLEGVKTILQKLISSIFTEVSTEYSDETGVSIFKMIGEGTYRILAYLSGYERGEKTFYYEECIVENITLNETNITLNDSNISINKSNETINISRNKTKKEKEKRKEIVETPEEGEKDTIKPSGKVSEKIEKEALDKTKPLSREEGLALGNAIFANNCCFFNICSFFGFVEFLGICWYVWVFLLLVAIISYVLYKKLKRKEEKKERRE